MKIWMVIISLSFTISMTATAEVSDVNIDGPIDGQYIVTLIYRDYTYRKIITGKPDSQENIKALLKWEEQKMEERDATVPHRQRSAQVP